MRGALKALIGIAPATVPMTLKQVSKALACSLPCSLALAACSSLLTTAAIAQDGGNQGKSNSTASLDASFTNRMTESNYAAKDYRKEGSFASDATYANDFSYWLEDNATSQTFTNVDGEVLHVRNLAVGGLLENAAFDPSGRGPQRVCDPVGSLVSSDCQTINTYLFPNPNPESRIIATYHRKNGFSGIYTYEGVSGNITADVSLRFERNSYAYIPTRYYPAGHPQAGQVRYSARPANYSTFITGTIGNNITINGDNFGSIAITSSIDPKTGTFNTDDHPYGGGPYFGKPRIPLGGGSYSFLTDDNVTSGTGSVKGSLSNNGKEGDSKAHLPTHLAGEIRMQGFYHGSDSTNAQHNKLVGAFVGEKK